MRRRSFAGTTAALAGATLLAGRPARAQGGPRVRMPAVATETFAETLYAQECGGSPARVSTSS